MTAKELNIKIAEIKGLKFQEGQCDELYVTDKDEPRFIDLKFKNWAMCIEDAWELFEEMSGGIFIGKSVTHKDGYEIWEINENGIGMHLLSNASTAPITICTAWIEWKKHVRGINDR